MDLDYVLRTILGMKIFPAITQTWPLLLTYEAPEEEIPVYPILGCIVLVLTYLVALNFLDWSGASECEEVRPENGHSLARRIPRKKGKPRKER